MPGPNLIGPSRPNFYYISEAARSLLRRDAASARTPATPLTINRERTSRPMASRTKHDFAAGLQRVYGYARVSTDRQSSEGVSLAEQEHRIRARCAENGWTLEHVYVDAGVSGSTPLGKRPQGARLLAMLRPGDVMIAAKMDRVFRSASDALVTIEGSSCARLVFGCSTWVAT